MNSGDPYEEYMRLALEAAQRGRGAVEPNPLVGAVILDAQGQMVTTGWHERYGGPHAEIVALQQAGERARGGTLIVTLEPCCHYGKTPPCTEAIIQAGIRRVVAALVDPFPAVAGQGLHRLRQAGIEVIVGVAEAEARRLNAAYLKRLTTGQPWVHVKWAMSVDGSMASGSGESRWISNADSRQRVHQLRGLMDAIVVGSRTVCVDDPLLTVRPPGPRVPRRVVVSGRGQLPEDCQLLRTARQVPTLLYTSVEALPRLQSWQAAGVEIVTLPQYSTADPFAISLSLPALLEDLARRGCTHILVEGGAALLSSFWQADAIDEWHIFLAPLLLGTGRTPIHSRPAHRMHEAFRLTHVSIQVCDDNAYLHGYTPRGPFADTS
jgi:diaminohydroxyphosphoribosylaminopyrimidine deaminase/5-amino-6-(5-phosphoribosylamino)uracil reductase